MSQTRYVINGAIIPSIYEVDQLGKLSINIGTEDRNILFNYKLYKNDVCCLHWYGTQWYEYVPSTLGGAYSYNVYSSLMYCMSGWKLGTISASTSATSTLGPYPSYPSNNKITISSDVEQRTCYESHLSHTGNGTVTFYRPEATYYNSHTFSGAKDSYKFKYTYKKIGGVFSEEAFNNAAPLHLGGEDVEFRAAPSDTNKYRVKCWKVNGSQVAGTGTNTYSVSMRSSDMDIVCEFEQFKWSFTAKTANSAMGSVTGATTSALKEKDTKISLTAVPKNKNDYTFVGWYRGYGNDLNADACIERISTEESLTYVMDSADVTIVAKFASRQTSLSVNVNDTTGATFDIYVNDALKKSNVTSYSDTNARDWWKVRLVTRVKDTHIFSHWTVPNGTTGSVSNYKTDFSMTLFARSENKFTLNVTKKEFTKISCQLIGIKDSNQIAFKGSVSYSGDLGGKGSITHTSTSTTATSTLVSENTTAKVTYVNTDYVFSATEVSSTRLYRFDYWRVKVGGEWLKVTESNKQQDWIKSVQGDKILVNIPNTDKDNPHELSAVFTKRPTYTIRNKSIEGAHPITKDSASGSGCKFADLPPADETISGLPYWVEGTKINVSILPAANWVVDGFIVALNDGTGEKIYDNVANIELEMNCDVLRLTGKFKAQTYLLKVDVENASRSVADATLEYVSSLDGNDKYVWKTIGKNSPGVEVYVNTPIRLNSSRIGVYNSAQTKFVSWIRKSGNNEIITSLPENVTEGNNEKAISDATYILRWASKITVEMSGKYTESSSGGSTDYFLGEAKISYTEDGVKKTYTVPDKSKNVSFSVFLVCGSKYTILATAKNFTTSVGANIESYFNGWKNKDVNSSVETLISGWGPEVEDVVVDTPKTVVASFSKENRWPILRLRNHPSGNYCGFSVSNVRTERDQQVNENELVSLTNPNDYFATPYSVVQIQVLKYSDQTRFLHWKEATITTDSSGKEMITVSDTVYSEIQDLSLYMTGNICLVPIFWTGTPINIESKYEGNSSTDNGDIYLESESTPIKSHSNQRKDFAQGDVVTFVAAPRNGYLFAGWYSDSSATMLVNESARYKITVDTPVVLYAKFEQDTNAIFIFGRSKEAKTMTWKSKEITTNSPISFSIAQVNAEDYETLKLSVGHSISPGVDMNVDEYDVANSNTRKLKHESKAKVFVFGLESTKPINNLALSTSITELLGGTNG